MTITTRHHWLLALILVACTSLDAREPGKAITPTPDAKTADLGPKTGEVSAVTIGVASVSLEQDCPDPTPSSVVPGSPPVMPAKPTSEAMPADGPAQPHRGPPSAAGHRMACQQSTLQLKVTNAGDAAAQIRIASIQLRDVGSNSMVISVASRLPSAWSDAASYETWDERIAAKSALSVSYRLTPPNWGTVESKLGTGSDSHGRPFELEITVEVDGKPITVRSPAFTRAPPIVMPPT